MVDAAALQKRMKAKPFQNLSDVIYEALFDDIIHLHILPGAKLNEKQIADNLGVSRSPVNAALHRLLDDGLLNKDGGKSLQVIPMKKEECRQLYESRISIEGYAVYLSVFRITAEQMQRLEQSIVNFERVIEHSIADQADFDAEFHKIIIEASQNPFIMKMYQVTELPLLRYRNSLRDVVSHDILRSILRQSCKSHRAVLNAMKLGFADTARTEMERHITMMLDAISEWK